MTPILPSSQQQIGLDDVLLVLDGSGSMSSRSDLAEERGLLESLASAMPEGDYGVGLLVFGGDEMQRSEIERFDRASVLAEVAGLQDLGGATRLTEAVREIDRVLPEGEGRRAIILVSDGIPRTLGARETPGAVLRVAEHVIANRSDELCFHTIHVGSSREGAALLEDLAALTSCGSYRSESELVEATAIQGFGREVFFVAADESLPAVAARPVSRDSDRDGVENAVDLCAGTLFGVTVDRDGCWQAPDVLFDSNSSLLTNQARQELGVLAGALARSPQSWIRVVGHTDDTGKAGYNDWLAERRANRVRDFLIADGVDAERIGVETVGAADPRASNDSEAGRSRNRRVEVVVD